jgi:hypothetical protein
MCFGEPPGRLLAGNVSTTYETALCPLYETKKEGSDGSVYVVAERSFVVLYHIENDVVLKSTCGK